MWHFTESNPQVPASHRLKRQQNMGVNEYCSSETSSDVCWGCEPLRHRSFYPSMREVWEDEWIKQMDDKYLNGVQFHPLLDIGGVKRKPLSVNVCAAQCCPGWTVAPKTGTCTRAICTPRCKNGGLCKKPQTCVCKSGFVGTRCEKRTSSSIHIGVQERLFNTSSSSLGPCTACEAVTPTFRPASPTPITITTSTATTTMPVTNMDVPSKLKYNKGKLAVQPAKNRISLKWQSLRGSYDFVMEYSIQQCVNRELKKQFNHHNNNNLCLQMVSRIS
ncbi:latent-transforming growth factor beta-binding 1-like [Pelobates cultripes]|uniref:Latent-transforming growth factor beta-binding 1-like n=1 Tax=Pelobates cultripes TaxID=61616 RepID=A0AAD1WLY5_PELCU|nr:latent-transforming growth factor beta-binding 1-like [Pelobates cultripes]